MQVLLINPLLREDSSGKRRSKYKYKCTPLGLATLAASLRAKGISAGILDMPALELSTGDALRFVRENSPEIIGIGSTSGGFEYSSFLARRLKKASAAKIILGGFHASLCPESLSKYKEFDHVLSGEGELSFPLAAARILAGKKVPRIICGKSPKNLDILPVPAYDLLPIDRYFLPTTAKRPAYLEASRGCPFGCSFCSIKKGAIRYKSPEKVVDEMLFARDCGAEFVEFSDETFTFSRERTLALCREILKRNASLEWGCQTRCDMIDGELAQEMRKAGCRQISFGVESGSFRVRKRAGKPITDQRIIEAFRVCKEAGIETGGLFLVGLPGETREDLSKTLEFADRLSPTYCQFVPVAIYPNTPLFREELKQGRIKKGAWDRFARGGEIPLRIPDYFGKEEFFKFLSRSNRRYYLSPRRAIERLFSIRSFSDIARYAYYFSYLLERD